MALDGQITDLVGGTIDQAACDQWAQDACKEIIHQLPAKLKAKCSTLSIINATNGTTLDLDGIGDILSVTRLSADSGGYYIPCREVDGKYGDLTNDSTNLTYYATVTDPAFYITSNSSDVGTLFVKPTPTDAQPANAYHITYPSVNVDAVNTIANFPDEAEALVVLYAAARQLLQYQSTMSSTFNTSIGTALTAIATEIGLAKAEVAEIVSQTDNSSDIATACTAINTELDKVDEIIIEASTEFDKVDNVIVEGSTELDKSTALLDLGETDTEGAVNTALTAMKAELDETQGICDNMHSEILLANAEVDGMSTTLAGALDLTATSQTDIKVALDAMNTATDKFRADSSDPALFGDESTYETGGGLKKVGAALDKAIAYIDGNSFSANYDLEATLGDVDAELTNEDIDLASARMQQAQTQMAAVTTQISLAQTHIAEWNTAVNSLVAEVNSFAAEASARYGWINAIAVGWQGKLSSSGGYLATASGYASEIAAKINIANGYASEINIRLSQAGAKRQESQSRLTAGSAYLQEASAIVSDGNAYLSEAQAYIAQANGYAAEVNARTGFTSAKMQAVQGYINTASTYASEATTRLTMDSAKYQWYGDQYAKITAEYARGLAALKG